MVKLAKCDQCGREFGVEPTAPHKRFCGYECRKDWWKERRREGERRIKEQEKKKEAQNAH